MPPPNPRTKTDRKTDFYYSTIRTTVRRRERKERPQPFSLQKKPDPFAWSATEDLPAQFRNILCPGKEGERCGPILLPEILFSATVLRCIAEFFLDKRRECGQQRVSSLPLSLLSFPREKGFFPTTLFAKIRSNGSPPPFFSARGLLPLQWTIPAEVKRENGDREKNDS